MVWLVSLILMATITLLSLLRGDAWVVRVTPRPIQKALHIVFYAALAFGVLSAQVVFDLPQRISIPLTVFSVLAFSAVLEWLQSFRPGRFPRAADVALDAIGVILGVAICLIARA